MASSSTASSSAQLGLGLGLGLGAMGGLGLLLPADREHDPELEPCSPPKGVLRLRGAVQHYEWGSRGDASLVARLAGKTEEGRPCAELWMGTHPAAPSSLASDDGGAVSLREWLARNPAALLGRAVTARWDGDLPFLFKVLSVAKPLSIQAHPDRELARALHALRPTTYRDANHKPEMAVAVTEFRALCGFVSVQELKDVLRTVPEVQMLVGKQDVVKLMTAKEHDGGIGVRSYLQSAFTKLMATSKEAVAAAISKLKSRLNGEIKIRTFTEKEQLVLSLEQQYPGDVGVLSAFFFNYVKLSPGEALYIGANEPHAYLSGECVECMATSDNVIRAGLTPKYKDVQTLCSMLTYKQMFPEILQGVLVQPYVIRYTPPFDEFEVDCYSLPQGESVTMLPVPGPSIFLVMTGEGEIQADGMPDEGVAKEGDVLFVPACTEVKLHASGSGCLQLYRAGVNSRFFC
ncbi:mannose-6-phosphate isomerase 1-like [Triticum urartu]|uniref:Mannose-6-phosphate isomerase n=2 Tax=Triticum TaxID=4564 RepID=A0A8R7RDY8_TRIUA|nr:mannose-6-phosphate isomerase 1-like [Triticum urartu]XP_048570449.1 mannose-6-phosphate isomerase 1-like [Triticum urartu]